MLNSLVFRYETIIKMGRKLISQKLIPMGEIINIII